MGLYNAINKNSFSYEFEFVITLDKDIGNIETDLHISKSQLVHISQVNTVCVMHSNYDPHMFLGEASPLRLQISLI